MATPADRLGLRQRRLSMAKNNDCCLLPSWKFLTRKSDSDYQSLRDATIEHLKSYLPDLIDDDFNPYDGIGWDENGAHQSIDALTLALSPPSREMPGWLEGTYFIFVQTTKISPEQILEITSLVSEFGYASIWVLGGTADATDNCNAAIACSDEFFTPSLFVGKKGRNNSWNVLSLESESLSEAAAQTAKKRKTYWLKAMLPLI